jgi:hypothetical protein
MPIRRLVILFIADLVGGILYSQFHNGFVSLIFLIQLILNIVIFIKMSGSDTEKGFRRKHPRAGAMRRSGYFWVWGLFMFILVAGYREEPWWATLLGLSFSGILIWGTFRAAKKMEVMDTRT